MTLFKISVSNIRKSLRDYAVYFFTLVIGVSIFYVFNAIGTQAAYLKLSNDTRNIVELLNTMLSSLSVFVAVILGLLIVYANRFLMKRRNKEFALYLMLGMDKGTISLLLFLETILIGIGSLGIGMLIGIGLSQLMSAAVANLFDADMTSYAFTLSVSAIIKTLLYFGLMYLVVILFNSIAIGRYKLIDLMQSGKRSEKMKLKNPALCCFIFLLSICMLGYAYYSVGWKGSNLNQRAMICMILLGTVATFFFFWSVSGLLLRMVMSLKNTYHRSLNCFTFRQVSSQINTMVSSMTIICLMLFVTICTLASAFSIRNSMNANLQYLCPADFEIQASVTADKKEDSENKQAASKENAKTSIDQQDHSDNPVNPQTQNMNIMKICREQGLDLDTCLADYVHFHTYTDKNFTFGDFCGDSSCEKLMEQYPFLENDTEQIMAVSDYNVLMRLYGKKELSLSRDEYVVLCDFGSMKAVRDQVLSKGEPVQIFGHILRSQRKDCLYGFVSIAAQHIETGVFIVPDEVIDKTCANTDYVIGNYAAAGKDSKQKTEEKVQAFFQKKSKKIETSLSRQFQGMETHVTGDTKLDIASATIGLGAMVTFLGLYLGLVFLISCAAILALKQLSECVDNIPRYEILRKIGTEEHDIFRSLFIQTGIFFLLPLLLAGIHSIFGMKYSVFVLEVFGTEKLRESIAATSVMILLIYGGYYMITYLCSRSLAKGS